MTNEIEARLRVLRARHQDVGLDEPEQEEILWIADGLLEEVARLEKEAYRYGEPGANEWWTSRRDRYLAGMPKRLQHFLGLTRDDITNALCSGDPRIGDTILLAQSDVLALSDENARLRAVVEADRDLEQARQEYKKLDFSKENVGCAVWPRLLKQDQKVREARERKEVALAALDQKK